MLTESIVRNFANEDQTITIQDPQSQPSSSTYESACDMTLRHRMGHVNDPHLLYVGEHYFHFFFDLIPLLVIITFAFLNAFFANLFG